jgi:two-component system, chemotaxis family, sensor kinase Cph1
MTQDKVAAPSVSPWPQGLYSIKRHGATISNCDAEPVQTPGCVQDHGALLVLRAADLSIAQASENVERWLGLPPLALLEKPVSVAVGEDGETQLRNFIACEPTERNPIYAFTLPARIGAALALDVTVHTVDGSVLVEFEASGRTSTAEPDYYSLVKKTVMRLQAAETLKGFCDVAAEEFRVLTALDRVMIYKFHADLHGEVYAESKREDLPPWLGLHYPAEDIPKPARDIFMKIWVRGVPDVRAPLHELIPLAHPDTGRPLEMTHCTLRGASIMYTEYLQNMRVDAALTMPIRRDGELWGLIVGHHYSGPAQVTYAVRTACEFLAQVVSLQHKGAQDREYLTYRLSLEGVHGQLVSAAAQEGGLSAMTDGSPTLLDGMDASGAAIYHRDRWWRVGVTPTESELDALAEWLIARPELTMEARPLYFTDSLVRDYPPGVAFAEVASGVLALRLSRVGHNMLLWFRPEIIQTVQWGGNPHEMPLVTGPHGPRLTPRKSFELFSESVRQRSQPWRDVEINAAARLRFLIMEQVISRAEQLAALNADLLRSNEDLDAFAYVASHDLKEPLRGIHKYAHQLLETAQQADTEQRFKLEGLMRLTLRMDTLLDALLHFSRVGRVAMVYENVDLNEVVAEAVEMVGSRIHDGNTQLVIPRPLPTVRCDRVRCREIYVNLLSNALKYNNSTVKRIELGHIQPSEASNHLALPAEAAGQIVYTVRDNGVGIQEKHYDQVFKMFRRLHGRDEFGGGTGAGLTIVKKLVERQGGNVWLKSVPGDGTTFFFTLPCEERL